jgi:1-acyl-sn-glycerol-3-phosphate acyltransferase
VDFTVLAFGLCNAPAVFERLMLKILAGLTWKTCLVYLDDIIVFAKTFEEQIKNLEEVLHRLKQATVLPHKYSRK